MDWGTLIGTALGAVVGVGSAVVAERSRWKREFVTRERAVRRELYGEYLAALSRTRNELRSVARSPSTPAAERARLASESFRSGGAYELRYQMAITAPESVAGPSERALLALRTLNDRLEAGDDHTDATWSDAHEAFTEALAALRTAMRTDLGTDTGGED
jgi:hypothetical protein